ncbi:hypothetical protein [Streptomyces sp. CAU 1734]|uniref:hypothetical protein n=1 Tax=Streptomyces sp. CAU 1734 TaxID=3140360 RepID=UPI0032605545
MRADERSRGGVALSLVASVAALSLAAGAAPALAADSPAAAPAARSAAATAVGIGAAVTVPDARGLFETTAWTDAPGAAIASVSARIRDGASVIGEVAALEGTFIKGRYRVPVASALRLTEDGGSIPALGRYAIDVTATDTKGNTVTRTDAGTLDFTLRPVIGFQFDSPSWQERVVRPKGRLYGVQPGSGDAVGLPGRDLRIVRTGSTDTTHSAVTSESGEFTAPDFPVTGLGDVFKIAYTEKNAQVSGETNTSRSVHHILTRQITVTGAADRTRLLPGQTATVTGRALYGQELAAGVVLRVGLGYDARYGQTVTTDGDGRFTASVKGVTDARLSGWKALPVDGFLSGSAQGKLEVPAETVLKATSLALNAEGRASVWASARLRYQSGEVPNMYQTVHLERSADGKAGWKSIGAMDTDPGRPYSVRIEGNSTSGAWFRLRALGNEGYLESVTAPVRLHRDLTRVASVNASPEPVKYGKTVTVTGTVQARPASNAAWKALSKAKVQLWFKDKEWDSWQKVTSGTADSKGRVSLKARAHRDGHWLIRYFGDTKHFNSAATGGDFVDVR